MDDRQIGRNVVSDQIDETDKLVCSTDQSANATDPNPTMLETQIESPSDSVGVAAPSERTKPETQRAAVGDTRRELEAKPAAGGAEATQTQGPESRGSTTSPTVTATPPRNIGEIPQVLGDYALLEELGKGGMGIVFRARQQSVNRIVALKVIRPDRLADMTMTSRRKAIERFRTEAEAAARISHDNLVTVYEVGCEAGCHYFSMR